MFCIEYKALYSACPITRRILWCTIDTYIYIYMCIYLNHQYIDIYIGIRESGTDSRAEAGKVKGSSHVWWAPERVQGVTGFFAVVHIAVKKNINYFTTPRWVIFLFPWPSGTWPVAGTKNFFGAWSVFHTLPVSLLPLNPSETIVFSEHYRLWGV